MKIKKFRKKLFQILDASKKLKIASIAVDLETDSILFIELITGEKFEIAVRETDQLI